MNRDQMAHEYALKLIDRVDHMKDIAVNAFALADAMIEESKRRTETGFPLDEGNE